MLARSGEWLDLDGTRASKNSDSEVRDNGVYGCEKKWAKLRIKDW